MRWPQKRKFLKDINIKENSIRKGWPFFQHFPNPPRLLLPLPHHHPLPKPHQRHMLESQTIRWFWRDRPTGEVRWKYRDNWRRGVTCDAAERSRTNCTRGFVEWSEVVREHGTSPILNVITTYERDVDYPFFPTDVYLFHVDRSPVPFDTFLCTYYGESSDILPNDQAEKKSTYSGDPRRT